MKRQEKLWNCRRKHPFCKEVFYVSFSDVRESADQLVFVHHLCSRIQITLLSTHKSPHKRCSTRLTVTKHSPLHAEWSYLVTYSINPLTTLLCSNFAKHWFLKSPSTSLFTLLMELPFLETHQIHELFYRLRLWQNLANPLLHSSVFSISVFLLTITT